VQPSGDVPAERPTQSAALADALGRAAAALTGWIVEALGESHDGQVYAGGFLDRRRQLGSEGAGAGRPTLGGQTPGSLSIRIPQPSQILRQARTRHE